MENRLNVVTADAVAFSLEPAGLGTRVAAAAIDQGLLFLTLFTLSYFRVLSTVVLSLGLSSYTTAIMGVLAFLIQVGYYPFFEAVWAGQTPGKRLFKLRVVKETGQPIGMIEALLRGILRIVDVYLFAVGFLVAFITPKEQRLGDLVARTVVIRERPFELPVVGERVVSYSNLSRSEVEQVRAMRDRITPEELALVRRFLTYRDELDPEKRDQIAVNLARLATKVGLEPRLEIDAQYFLEDLYSICME